MTLFFLHNYMDFIKRGINYFFYLLFTLLLLSSCSTDTKEIQNLNFATALGVDYKDGQYHLYVQLVGLSSVASTEGTDSPPQTFVSESKGDTFIDSFFEVYESGQEKFIWSHITTILLSESVLEEGIENIFDGMSRYYEFRLTPWIFATKEPLDEILTTQGFFDQTTLDTLLHHPEQIYEQSSIIRPIKLHQLAREVYEPARTTYIPSIAINREQWQKNKEAEPKLAFDGAVFLQEQTYKGFFPLEQLKGLRWITPETVRASILIPSEKDADFLVVMDHLEADILLQEQQNKLEFDVIIKGEGNIANELKGLDQLRTMEGKTNDTIGKQIKELYQLGIESQIDFLNLEHIVYRERNKKWNQLPEGEFLHEDLLNRIHVDVSILHSGAFKNQKVKVNN